MSHFVFEPRFDDGPTLARAGVIKTSRGEINTPAFIPVATRAALRGVLPEQVKTLGAEALLGNTYHLCFSPGESVVAAAGGLGKFMNWSGPTFTDSGGFQAFSLGVAFGAGISKLSQDNQAINHRSAPSDLPPARVDDDGVSFRSLLDGSEHRLTPERSIQIQRALGADIIFVLDECAAPIDDERYQSLALRRTQAWSERCLREHERLPDPSSQALFGIVQGGRFLALRSASAKILASQPFAGYGIGGSFSKRDMGEALAAATAELPANKPRHLLGIGEPTDLILGVERGIDTFDCVTPTRLARHGTLYTRRGKINISNAKFKNDFQPIDENCACYTCGHYSRAYLAHLIRTGEMLAATLGSIHNLYFLINLTKSLRQAIVEGCLADFKTDFLGHYAGK